MSQVYDMAISFAGGQRILARSIARKLSSLGYQIFYDEYQFQETWAEQLSTTLHKIYSSTPSVLILATSEYLENNYTKFELGAILENYVYNHSFKILQVKLEKVEIPGIPRTVGFLDYHDDINQLCAEIAAILGDPSPHIPHKNYHEVKRVMEICFRRAIFTAMAEEINTEKMLGSITACIAQLSQFLPSIHNAEISQTVNGIIHDLDQIDRLALQKSTYTVLFPESVRNMIDKLKINIIDRLHYLNIRFAARMDLPNQIGLSYPFKLDHTTPFIDNIDFNIKR